MGICHVVRQYKPGVGGLETFVARLAQSLNQLGCRNEVLTLDRLFHDSKYRLPARDVIDGVRVTRAPMIGHSRFFLPLIPARALRPYDVIHVHGVDGMFDRLARQPRRDHQVLTATSHGLFFHTRWMAPIKRLYLKTATRLAALRYDLLIANSQSDMARLRCVTDKVVQLPNGVEPLGAFQATGRDVLCLGRLAQHKHVGRILEAMAQPELKDVRLHVVGPEWDVTRLDLARAADRLGLGDRVLLHGRLGAKQLAEVAKGCGLYVSASTYEGFGMSLIEAMSVGLVPVVEANASFVELMDAAKLGTVTDFSRPPLAARAMRQHLDALDAPQRKRAIAFAAQFSWDKHAERTLQLYGQARRRAFARYVM